MFLLNIVYENELLFKQMNSNWTIALSSKDVEWKI